MAMASRAETTTRLDLSDLCFVDDLVSFLMFLAKEPTLQVLQKWRHKCFSLGVFV